MDAGLNLALDRVETCQYLIRASHLEMTWVSRQQIHCHVGLSCAVRSAASP
jgi:hypothetical protein